MSLTPSSFSSSGPPTSDATAFDLDLPPPEHDPPAEGELDLAPVSASRGVVPTRDRIVILGRRRAGKTVYLARLYEKLWNSRTDFHMRALSGGAHRMLLEAVEQLRNGRWPAATLGSSYVDLEIERGGRKQMLITLDYPGEVFRRAFVDGADAPDTRELLDHVDRASGVLLLIDPAVALEGNLESSIDDTFGMVAAIRRIREYPGGDRVPMALIFTKCDQYAKRIRDEGGLRAFTMTHFHNVLRDVGRIHYYASAAVRCTRTDDGQFVPDIEREPVGLIEPIVYCLDCIEETEARDAEERRLDEYRVKERQLAVAQVESQRRSALTWGVFWALMVIVLTAVGIVTWLIVGWRR